MVYATSAPLDTTIGSSTSSTATSTMDRYTRHVMQDKHSGHDKYYKHEKHMQQSSITLNSIMTDAKWQRLCTKLDNYIELLLMHNEKVEEIRALIRVTQDAKRSLRNDLYNACFKTSPNVAELINVRTKAINNGATEDNLYLNYEYYEIFVKLSRADKDTVDTIIGLNEAIKAANIELDNMERELRKFKLNVVEVQRAINELHIVIILERAVGGDSHAIGRYRQYTLNIRRREVIQTPYRFVLATTDTKYKTPYVVSNDTSGAKSKSASPRLMSLINELESTSYDVVTTHDLMR